MKVKIINYNFEEYENIFKVRRMNFDKIIVNYPNEVGNKSFSFKDVECISENDIDEFLIKNREFLKIRLKRGISVNFYNALYTSIKIETKEEIKKLSVIRDKYKINKSGIWEKEILLIINNKLSLEILASGRNFRRSEYNIIINRLEKENCLELWYEEIKNIEREINGKSLILYGFKEDIEKFKNNNKIS
ncbi:hypothetical protein CLPUN_50120 [Clostridium puniceum]|uniref:Uncharacterized protein n=1 Tax=Clostridium puniceum TaxID=29367 RepID=A0A1S8T0S2_9CLOT|nr:hypothetical protein [Clostridium puniceum]OOM71282.1 hypothetical protein CLPUN_50120 [Clostridium puniceum]